VSGCANYTSTTITLPENFADGFVTPAIVTPRCGSGVRRGVYYGLGIPHGVDIPFAANTAAIPLTRFASRIRRAINRAARTGSWVGE
jgi:hypothetical protein